MAGLRQLHLRRALPGWERGQVFEIEAGPGEQTLLLWIGPAPAAAPPGTPGLARRGAVGSLVDGRPAWLEIPGPGALLRDWAAAHGGLPPSRWESVRESLRQILGELRERGLSHGDLNVDRIWLRADEGVELLGFGTGSNTPEMDQLALWRLKLEGPPLREVRGTIGFLVEQEPSAALDEPPIQPREQAGPMEPSEVTGVQTGGEDRTGSISEDTGEAWDRIYQSTRLGEELQAGDLEARFGGGERPPSAALRELILLAPPEPLPLPNGLPPPRLNPDGEAPSEITMSGRTAPGRASAPIISPPLAPSERTEPAIVPLEPEGTQFDWRNFAIGMLLALTLGMAALWWLD